MEAPDIEQIVFDNGMALETGRPLYQSGPTVTALYHESAWGIDWFAAECADGSKHLVAASRVNRIRVATGGKEQ
jgi:hypothetical protein